MPELVHTEDKLEYQFFPLETFEVELFVKAESNAHIALAPAAAADTGRLIEIFLGGWENTKSAIRLNQEKPDKAEHPTPNIIEKENGNTFVIRWTSAGKVEVFLKDALEPFLDFTNEEPFPITHFGVRTSWGATGEWKIDGVKEVSTPDSNDYIFFPVFQGNLTVYVKAASNAHLALTSGPADDQPITEIFLGGWDNTKSVIRHNKEKPEKAEAATEAIVTDGEFKKFNIRWNYAGVHVKPEGSEEALLAWTEPEAYPVTHYGIRTGWGAEGDWFVQGVDRIAEVPAEVRGTRTAVGDMEDLPLTWVPAANGEVPDGSFVGGHDQGDPLIVARAPHEDEMIVGKLLPGHGVAYVSWGGEEHAHEVYETLVVPPYAVSWVPTIGQDIPPNAVPGGQTGDGEPLFIGRVAHEDTLTIGKVHPSHGTCYIPYGGGEIGFPEYEILVLN